MTVNWGLLQLGVFLSTFCAFVAAERLWPRRALAIELISRWSANLGFTVVNAVAGTIVHLVLPIAVVAEAIYVEAHGYGLFPAIGASLWIAVPVTMAALDFSLYAFHVACHKLPLLWRFHRVHHLDLEVDATTAFRAHPFEYIFSQFLKLGVIYALGAPVVAVVAYEILLNVFAMFSHSNIGIAEHSDRWLRRFIVTPDMHRVHHSSYQPETDSNYGVVTPLWDRLFGTYTAATREPQTTMKLGLDEVRGSEAHNLFWLIGSPAVSFDARPAGDEAANTVVPPVTTSLRTPA
jgi:sterol desaturase/sphingolipid hydroxylase (fatty acid hydroxylase superfamily)